MTPYTPLAEKRGKKRKLPSSWSENSTPSRATQRAVFPPNFSIPFAPTPPQLSVSQENTQKTPQQRPPLSEKKNRPNYRQGYLTESLTPSRTPYTLKNHRNRARKAFETPSSSPLQPLNAIDIGEWNKRARKVGLLKEAEHLREFQAQVANWVIQRKGDLCVIAPTGSGKSLVWALPLAVYDDAISLVIVPYTSLGHQGEIRSYGDNSFSSHFLYSENKRFDLLEKIASGRGRQIVYLCPEMLESPSMAQVLHSLAVQHRLLAIYLDEAHTAHESKTWRPAYTQLHLLRRVCNLSSVPLVAVSATLPTVYRNSLSTLVGLKPDYHLINLGNSRPELSVIVKNMEHHISSFRDLEFIFPSTYTQDPESIKPTIIFTDDIERLTAMFWWCREQLRERNLPVCWVDLIHAGLSESHQEWSTKQFAAGKTRLWLGTEKVGAGIDFPHVQVVVQYCCRDLSLVQWEQRRGRAARSPGSQAVGILLVEKSMTAGDGQRSVASPGYEDPGLLKLIHSKPPACLTAITNRLLENPNPDTLAPCRTRCSHCNPDLLTITRSFVWIPVDFVPDATMMDTFAATTEAQQSKIVDRLRAWRLKTWEADWKDVWLFYGPDNIVGEADIRAVAVSLHQIRSIDDLEKRTQILHFDDIAAGLMEEIKQIQVDLYGDPAPQVENAANKIFQIENGTPPALEYTKIEWAAVCTSAATPTARHRAPNSAQKSAAPRLQHNEFILTF
ncbi:hypothetical protein EST38_g13408 [Candolleomyces aberdarensis]|uniref:DNA 3'-5' helicase n=1 Tax=Candolleomyces aberdarensis TaxID=2316362 RepID=A0A4Q2D2Q8_9AGAR|nr:hypothetical protein EST38_g13408 [Candolleomyces aberdarensis]